MLNGGGSLAKYLNEEDSDDDGQDQEGEEDLKDDPIYVLDLQVSSEFDSSRIQSVANLICHF